MIARGYRYLVIHTTWSVDGEDRMRAMAIVIHEATRSKKGGSSFRLKAGVLPFPIGDNNSELHKPGVG